MSSCPNCNNAVKPGTKQCFYCGFIFSDTHFLVLKAKPKKREITIFHRVAASIIDMSILLLPFFLYFAITAYSGKEPHINKEFGIWLTEFLIIGVQITMLVNQGQTIGKKIMKIAIVENKTNEHPSVFKLIVLRTILPIIPFIIPILGISLLAINLAWALGDEQRCLHDFIAGTAVVEE